VAMLIEDEFEDRELTGPLDALRAAGATVTIVGPTAGAEFKGKRAVLKINNVGTMKPGRLFDLSRAAMEYFGGIDKGLISNLKVTVLPLGRHYKLGPLTGEVEEIIVTRAPAPATSDVAPATAVAATPPASLDPKPLAIPVIGPAVEAVVDAIVPPAATEPNDHGHGHGH